MVTALERHNAWNRETAKQVSTLQKEVDLSARRLKASSDEFREARQEQHFAGLDRLKHGDNYVNPNRRKMPRQGGGIAIAGGGG